MKQQNIKTALLITAASLVLSGKAIAQYDDLKIMADNNNERNFVAAPAFGNVEPTLFEANIAPTKWFSFHNGNAGIELKAKFIVRMLNRPSCPINTPSYMPSVSVYKKLKLFADSTSLIGKLTLGHHSNGQNASFLNEDGSVNTENGNFATDYIKCSMIKGIKNAGIIMTAFEQHLNIENCHAQVPLYGLTRLHLDFKSNYFDVKSVLKKVKQGHFLQLTTQNTLIVSKMKGVGAFNVAKRVISNLFITYKPAAIKDLALFVQYYIGQDYYNVNFVNQLSFFRVGVSLEPSNFIKYTKNSI